jgi:hypothetical protein
MKPMIVEFSGYTVDTNQGMQSLGWDVVGNLDKYLEQEELNTEELFDDIGDYLECFNHEDIYSIEKSEGYNAYLSAPGYMDRTENTVFETAADAANYLIETYYDKPEDEMEDDEREELADLESFAKAQA